MEELKQWATSDIVHPEALPYETVQRLRRFEGVYRSFRVDS